MFIINSFFKPTVQLYGTTWNPSDKDTNIVLTNGNLTASNSSTGRVRSTFSTSTGKHYWEITLTDNSNYSLVGVCKSSDQINTTMDVGSGSYALYNYGNPYALYHDSNYSELIGFNQVPTNGVIGVMLDLDSGTLGFKTADGVFAAAFTGLSGTYYAGFSGGSPGYNSEAIANFGASQFTFSVPVGYSPGFGTI